MMNNGGNENDNDRTNRCDIMTNQTTELKNGRGQRTQKLLDIIEQTQITNMVGIDFLKGIIEDNPERVFHGENERPDSNLIVYGDLANYCIPLEPIIRAFVNPFSSRGNFPMVEVHPLGRWVRHNSDACIQTNGHEEIPGTDSFGILVAALISDRELFQDPSQDSFRNALLRTYGTIHSPVSESYSNFLDKQYGAKIDFDAGVISIEGTHGFTWYLGGIKDPTVRSYSLSSSVRGGPHRKHTDDTFFCLSVCKDLSFLLPCLSKLPRIFLDQDDDHSNLINGREIVSSVAEHWAPLRKAIESGDIELEPEDLDY